MNELNLSIMVTWVSLKFNLFRHFALSVDEISVLVDTVIALDDT